MGCYAKLEGFAFLPITSFGIALTTFVGQNLGAKEYTRAKEGARFGIVCSVVLAELIGALLFAFGPFFLSMFTSDSEVIANGTRQIRVEAFFYCLLALSHAIGGVFRGAGKPNVPMLIMLSCWCVIRVIALTVLLAIWHNVLFVYIIYPSTWALSSICFVVMYFTSDWLHFFDRQETTQETTQEKGETV